MSTAGLICVVKNNEYLIAQKGAYDHMPQWQGASVLRWLKYDMRKHKFADALKNILRVTKDDVETLKANFTEPKVKPKHPVFSDFEKMYPEFGLQISHEILQRVQDQKCEVFPQVEFAADPDCQWAYVIDLDNGKFEVFKGNNKQTLTEADRFYKLQGQTNPVRLVKSYELTNLPRIEDFVAEFATE